MRGPLERVTSVPKLFCYLGPDTATGKWSSFNLRLGRVAIHQVHVKGGAALYGDMAVQIGAVAQRGGSEREVSIRAFEGGGDEAFWEKQMQLDVSVGGDGELDTALIAGVGVGERGLRGGVGHFHFCRGDARRSPARTEPYPVHKPAAVLDADESLHKPVQHGGRSPTVGWHGIRAGACLDARGRTIRKVPEEGLVSLGNQLMETRSNLLKERARAAGSSSMVPVATLAVSEPVGVARKIEFEYAGP